MEEGDGPGNQEHSVNFTSNLIPLKLVTISAYSEGEINGQLEFWFETLQEKAQYGKAAFTKFDNFP